jgi:hypothetical protein
MLYSMRTQRSTIAALLLLVLASCSGAEEPRDVPRPFEPSGSIELRELPDPLLDHYKMNRRVQLSDPEAFTGYDFASLDKSLDVYETPAGSVFVDSSGLHAWSESCEAMRVFVAANAWGEYGHGCLDG